MTDRRHALTPEALEMMDTIARTGSFAAAARELGKVPSALTYSVRQLEEALDVLLFDRSSRQAQLTAAGAELLHEGRRLLAQMDAVANRVQRVATGWETTLAIAVDNIVAPRAIFDLIEAFYALRCTESPDAGPLPTRLKLRNEVMAGTLEALLNGHADLVIGLGVDAPLPQGVQSAPLGTLEMLLAVAPHHPLAALPEPLSLETVAQHRVVALADTAQRLDRQTHGIQPGQDVLTVPSLVAKLEAQIRGLGCGRLPEPLLRAHVAAGRLVVKRTEAPPTRFEMRYAWRGGPGMGRALAWWLQQLESPVTRLALLEQHAGLIL
ncbi:LysR substrate-binding domain-containing protein [Sphaerotilus sp.]|uniref:LysR substrate-binding domain-containing protein n=1 Tax=Sphaerotilus sp. TaxID=2093942 RepID=UPI002ACEA846|nr:LysR substrate-binding domain-containing protein [Sphaerotilus sp.]MDZ7857743.1 LysR substrate-binding domain-containing protein [Sphaerotilus sp.]